MDKSANITVDTAEKPFSVAGRCHVQSRHRRGQGKWRAQDSDRDVNNIQFTAIFSDELHRAGFCCNGHVHRSICQDHTRRVSPPQRRSVQGMEKLITYRLSNRDPVAQPLIHLRVSEQHHERSSSSLRERTPEQKQKWWIQNHLKSGTARYLCQAVDRPLSSRFLCAEEVRIKYSLSEKQITAIMALSASMFGSETPISVPQSASTAAALDVQDWKDTVMLYQEHQSLRQMRMCPDHRKLDSETRAEVIRRHVEIEELVRENYLKAMRRLNIFCDRTALPFPPKGNIFLHWYVHGSILRGWTYIC